MFFMFLCRKETKLHFDKAIDSISLAKEVAEGLRIMMDFYLEKHLLYDSERKAFEAATVKAREMAASSSAEDSPSKSLRERRKSGRSTSEGGQPTAATAGSAVTAHATAPPGGDLHALPESSKDSVMSGNSSVQLPSLLTPPGSTPNTPQSIQVRNESLPKQTA